MSSNKRILLRAILGGSVGLVLGISVLPIRSCCAPPDTTIIFWRLFFALFILPFVVAVGFLIGAVILAINRILKRNPTLIIRMIIGIVIAGCLGVIGSQLDNANSVARGFVPAGMIFARYGVLVGALSGILATEG